VVLCDHALHIYNTVSLITINYIYKGDVLVYQIKITVVLTVVGRSVCFHWCIDSLHALYDVNIYIVTTVCQVFNLLTVMREITRFHTIIHVY